MKILVKAFAAVKDICGFDEKELIVSDNITVLELVQQLAVSSPGIGDMEAILLFAVNEEYRDGSAVLNEGDTLAIFPPVSGG
ncbi:MAG: MoaD/ThiS family protein [bacterium]|nr:MoaD/ThiS family protein [bacterium]